MTYSVFGHNEMMSDDIRRNAHNLAARECIKPGSVVAEVGTGNGYYAVMACKLGAKKVYAIESHDIIELAARVVKANGCEDRVELVTGMSTGISLPERVDVVFCDLRGALPLYGMNIPSVIDARTRFLKPGGILVPKRDELFGAFVSSEKIYKSYTEPQPQTADEPDMSVTRQAVRSVMVHESTVETGELMSEPLHLGTINYETVDSPHFRSQVSWTATQRTTIHGMSLWFDAHLTDSVSFSTSPFGPPMIYARWFLPLASAVDVEPGDKIDLSLACLLIEGQYTWRWNTVVMGKDGEVKSELQQSSLEQSRIAPIEKIMRSQGSYVPPVTDNRRFLVFVLQRVDGARSLEAIAHELAAQFPERFPELKDALSFASYVVEHSR